MPSHLDAGTYVVTVATSDADGAILQVARPGEHLTPQRFVALQDANCAAATPGHHDVETAFRRWRTSVSFLGGATAVPAPMSNGYAGRASGVNGVESQLFWGYVTRVTVT